MSTLGTTALGWVDVPMLLPVDGVHAERIQVQSVSLTGVTTTRLRAIKRRFQLPLRLMTPWEASRIQDMYEATGPLWLFDATREQLTPIARRHMRQWIDTDGVRRDSGTNLRLTLPASKIMSWEPQTGPPVSALAAVPASTPVTASATLWATGGSTASVQLGIHWYNAAGTYLSTNQGVVTALTFESRPSVTFTSPASAAFAQMMVLTTASLVSITDPVLGSKDRPGWTVVGFDDLTAARPNSLLTAPTLSLREV